MKIIKVNKKSLGKSGEIVIRLLGLYLEKGHNLLIMDLPIQLYSAFFAIIEQSRKAASLHFASVKCIFWSDYKISFIVCEEVIMTKLKFINMQDLSKKNIDQGHLRNEIAKI